MRVRGMVLASAVVAFLCGCNDSQVSSAIPDIPHTVLNEDVSETPGKAQITENLLVHPDITEADLRTLLERRYEVANQRSGFRYHEHPTVVAIYAYPSREHAESGMGQWAGMLLQTPGDSVPRITIHPSVGKPSTEEERFGLPEVQRRDIYSRIVEAEDRGQADAELKHPTDYIKQAQLASELSEANKGALAKELKLTVGQLREIALEGLTKNWPMPKQ
jgi:hypothetical protein